jgi:hypothetical protein
MFIGHFGVAMAAKKWAPQTSLPVLVLAAEFVDVLWPMAMIAGVEHVRIDPGNTPVTPLNFYDYPWTHSLLMGFVWAAAFAAVYFGLRKYRAGAIACGALVLSHWLLDFVSHRPDLPLVPGSSAVYGLGLWYSRLATVAVEVPIFIVGAWLYASTTRAKDKVGAWGWRAFVAFLLLMYAINIQGTPPPSVGALQWSALIGTLILLLWAWWIEQHRGATLN